MLERLNVVLYFLKLTSFLSHYGFYCFYLQLLKRKSSVLDSDIGSVGPIRRIRHKPNLLSSKSSRTAIGGSPLSEKSLFSSILNRSSDAETSGTHVAPVALVSSMAVQPVGLASQPESSSSRSVSTFQHLINCLGNIFWIIDGIVVVEVAFNFSVRAAIP